MKDNGSNCFISIFNTSRSPKQTDIHEHSLNVTKRVKLYTLKKKERDFFLYTNLFLVVQFLISRTKHIFPNLI